ncbi:MAG: uracil-DNA glycosylase [Alphaproteobacteria bacterium]
MQHALKLPTPDLPFADYSFPRSDKSWNGLVLVGEAPGAEEARLKRPFVGRSGQLLDKILEKASIDREQCLIANVFRRQPPGNKVDHFFASRRAATTQGFGLAEAYGKFGSAFCRTEFSTEIDHLRDMLMQQKPKIVIALGRTPLWALTGENGLLSKVGRTLPCRLMPSLKVIPTFHPSFILRGNWKLQDEWLSHFQLATKYFQ